MASLWPSLPETSSVWFSATSARQKSDFWNARNRPKYVAKAIDPFFCSARLVQKGGVQLQLIRCRAQIITARDHSVVEEDLGKDGGWFFSSKEEGGLFVPPLGWLSASSSSSPPPPGELREMVSGFDFHFAFPNLVQANRNSQEWQDVAKHFLPVMNSTLLNSSPPPQQLQRNDIGDDYHINVGYAIRSLRDELPGMFYKEPTFDIYRDDITFRDPLNTFNGIDNYKLIFWALRFHGRIFFKTIWVEVLRVWQPTDKVIMLRWTVHGIPRVPWEAKGQFSGTSEYKLDKDGKIYEHKLDNLVMNNLRKYKALTVLELVAVAGGQTTPTPSFFQWISSGVNIFSPYLKQFTWVRFYLALKSTVLLNDVSTWCDGCS